MLFWFERCGLDSRNKIRRFCRNVNALRQILIHKLSTLKKGILSVCMQTSFPAEAFLSPFERSIRYTLFLRKTSPSMLPNCYQNSLIKYLTSAYYFRILLHTIKEPTTAVWSIFAHRSLKPIGVHNGRDSQTVEQIAEEKMSKGHILIFEKHAGTSNSFYTMIVQDGQQFLANYGICDGAGFVRSILKPQAQWDSTIQDRLNHGYMRVYTGTIDYDKYVVMLRKIAQLSQKAGTDTTVAWLHYILLKTGKLSGGEMVEANSINMGMGSC